MHYSKRQVKRARIRENNKAKYADLRDFSSALVKWEWKAELV